MNDRDVTALYALQNASLPPCVRYATEDKL